MIAESLACQATPIAFTKAAADMSNALSALNLHAGTLRGMNKIHLTKRPRNGWQ